MINMIVAVSKNGIIGKNNSLPWHISEDLKHFKRLTMDGILFVGKNTAKSLPNLPGRDIVVLNRSSHPLITDAIDITRTQNKIGWIAGGGAVYRAALENNICDKIYLTFIDEEFEGDTYFPLEIFNDTQWLMIHEEVLNITPLTKFQIWHKV